MSKSSDKRARRAKRAEKSRQRRADKASGVASFLHAASDIDRLVDEFGPWLATAELAADIGEFDGASDLVRIAIEGVSAVRHDFTPTAWSATDIETVIQFAEYLEEAEPDDPVPAVVMVFVLRMFLDYLHQTEQWTATEAEWTTATAILSAQIMESVAEELPEIEDIDPAREAEALSQLGIIRRLDSLLKWIGRDKPVTPAHWLKPALIGDLADTLGIELGPEVKKMGDDDKLAHVWVLAQEIELITVFTTKACPGPASYDWRSGDRLPVMRTAATLELEALLSGEIGMVPSVVSGLVGSVLYQGMTASPFDRHTLTDDDTDSRLDRAMNNLARRLLDDLVADGWLLLTDEGEYVVPMELRPVVDAVVSDMDDPVHPFGDPVDDDPFGVRHSGINSAAESFEAEPAPPALLTLRLEMPSYIEPAVWRRVAVANTLTLGDLHVLIQLLMSWNDSHLHQFTRREGSRTTTFTSTTDVMHSGFASEREAEEEHEVLIGEVLGVPGDVLDYDYDFGDSWEVRIVLESVGPMDGTVARVIDGSGRAPLDDVGGPPGWAEFIDAVTDPTHERHDELRDWAGLKPGAAFDPAAFDADKADTILQRMVVKP
ncbi:plasmid pRiA4b ORF-3 family protein [Gordonia sp. NPDC003424]